MHKIFKRRPKDVFKMSLGDVHITMFYESPQNINLTILTKARNDLKRPETTYKTYMEQETTWNELKRPTTSKKRPEISRRTYNEQEATWNDPQRVRHNLQWPKPTYNEQQKRRETTNSKQIFRLFYNIGQTVLFSTQHLVAIIRALVHGESILSCVFFTGYKIYFFLSGFRVKNIHKSQINK